MYQQNSTLLQGLYYSYYKTIVLAPTFLDGLYEITRDNVTEHGHEINTLRRFNLYPEVSAIHHSNERTYNAQVALAFAYRQYKALTKQCGIQTEQCFQTNRGDNMPPIISCEGKRIAVTFVF